MKTKRTLLVLVVLLNVAGLAVAQEGELGVTFEVSILSKYIWRGFDIYQDDVGAFQPSIDLDFYGTGFGAKVLSSRANDSGFENSEEMDFSLYFANEVYEGESYTTDYKVGWVYYSYPDEPREAKDMQEFFAQFAWPQICPAGLVPSYTIIRMWPSKSDSSVSDNGGWAHIFGLGYDWDLAKLDPEAAGMVLHLSTELVYNDGFAPGTVSTGSSVDHDWSHMLFGVSMDFDIIDNLTYTPAVYYQASMDDSVNNEDETWVAISMKYKF